MRLIDADALIEEFEEYEDYVRENSDCFVSASETSEVIDYLGELAMRMPTVEAEPVVHCKDCKHWGMGVSGEIDHVKCCEYARYMVGENGYCVYGERAV